MLLETLLLRSHQLRNRVADLFHSTLPVYQYTCSEQNDKCSLIDVQHEDKGLGLCKAEVEMEGNTR